MWHDDKIDFSVTIKIEHELVEYRPDERIFVNLTERHVQEIHKKYIQVINSFGFDFVGSTYFHSQRRGVSKTSNRKGKQRVQNFKLPTTFTLPFNREKSFLMKFKSFKYDKSKAVAAAINEDWNEHSFSSIITSSPRKNESKISPLFESKKIKNDKFRNSNRIHYKSDEILQIATQNQVEIDKNIGMASSNAISSFNLNKRKLGNASTSQINSQRIMGNQFINVDGVVSASTFSSFNSSNNNCATPSSSYVQKNDGWKFVSQLRITDFFLRLETPTTKLEKNHFEGFNKKNKSKIQKKSLLIVPGRNEVKQLNQDLNLEFYSSCYSLKSNDIFQDYPIQYKRKQHIVENNPIQNWGNCISVQAIEYPKLDLRGTFKKPQTTPLREKQHNYKKNRTSNKNQEFIETKKDNFLQTQEVNCFDKDVEKSNSPEYKKYTYNKEDLILDEEKCQRISNMLKLIESVELEEANKKSDLDSFSEKMIQDSNIPKTKEKEDNKTSSNCSNINKTENLQTQQTSLMVDPGRNEVKQINGDLNLNLNSSYSLKSNDFVQDCNISNKKKRLIDKANSVQDLGNCHVFQAIESPKIDLKSTYETSQTKRLHGKQRNSRKSKEMIKNPKFVETEKKHFLKTQESTCLDTAVEKSYSPKKYTCKKANICKKQNTTRNIKKRHLDKPLFIKKETEKQLRPNHHIDYFGIGEEFSCSVEETNSFGLDYNPQDLILDEEKCQRITNMLKLIETVELEKANQKTESDSSE